ncbi:MAG: NHLP family bacteriocin export ABC transporter peptidase/permease/ATPase subunit [Lachnospiraceae bacterium]|nr:NHLP family bacteriocin export ABC transporter peptidase/permease/ATPase subunit [Lachnospiraceae bacterium]
MKINKKPVTGGVAKVPVILQLEALECGAACLSMILAYYGKWIPLEQARVDCGVSRDGSNAMNVMLAARNYGMAAQGYRFEPEELQKDGEFPCIIFWEFNHFVVLDGFKKDKAVINDPARGRVEISMESFDKSFTGVCIMMEPSENFEPGGQKKSMTGFLEKQLSGTGAVMAFTVIVSLINALMGVINPVFSKMFVDRFLDGRDLRWTVPFFIFLSTFALIQITLSAMQAVYNLKMQGKLAIKANAGYMWHVLRMPVEFFTQRHAEDIAIRKRINQTLASTIINTLAPTVLNSIMMIVYLVVILKYSVVLTIIGLFGTTVNIVIGQYVSAKSMNISRVQMRDAAKLSAATVSGIEMIETVKSSGAENGFFEKWAGFQASVNKSQMETVRLTTYYGIIPAVANSVTNILIMGTGIWLIIHGNFSIGMLFAFQTMLNSFMAPVLTLSSAASIIREMRVNMERIEDVMEYPTDVEYGSMDSESGEHESPEEQKDLQDTETSDSIDKTAGTEEKGYSKLSGRVELKNVTFGYSRLAKPLIENFSMTVEPGQRVAFVGPSGCGKSTLSKLISGLYRPWSGEILFDGKPMEEIDRNVFTGSLAVVDQDIILFEDTVANNIKMWDNSIEDFEMILASRDASLHEDIMQRDGGYRYRMLAGGKDFSGGQRQRMEIARVLSQDPTVIIMDEATSALDAATEYEVVKSIVDRGITCIVIAHRLSTIRDCNEIIVMDNGKVVERGTHDELMAKHGKYEELISSE